MSPHLEFLEAFNLRTVGGAAATVDDDDEQLFISDASDKDAAPGNTGNHDGDAEIFL